MPLSLKDALKDWVKKANEKASKSDASAEALKLNEYTEIKCHFSTERGGISKVDKSLEGFSKCEVLSLSTNCIDKVPSLKGMSALRVLSIGRNNIKKLSGLNEVSGTLEQLWISYNQIKQLDGLETLTKLTTLYCSNNKIEKFSELEKIASLPNLEDVLFLGNPMYQNVKEGDGPYEVMKVLPKVRKIDGDLRLELEQNQREAKDEPIEG